MNFKNLAMAQKILVFYQMLEWLILVLNAQVASFIILILMHYSKGVKWHSVAKPRYIIYEQQISEKCLQSQFT